MLTRKQHQLLTYIAGHLQENGISPSFEEMKDALGLKSKSGVHRLITALEERGFIRRLPHRARALEILRLPGQRNGPAQNISPQDISPQDISSQDISPQNISPVHNGARPRPATVSTNVIETNFARPRAAPPGSSDDQPLTEIPLYGRIAAGTPIEALQNNLDTVSMPPSMLGNGEYYALEVAGESMIEAGILDGDTAIIERCDSAENGTIVVALIDSEEATLKRLRKKGHSIALEPANKTYETRIFGPDRVRVQGRLTAILRHY